MSSITAARLAATEYTYLADPRHLIQTEFGWFYNHPQFRSRTDAHQLMRVHCADDQVDLLLEHVDELYAGTGLDYQKVSGYDLATLAAIKAPLKAAGWRLAEHCWMLPFQGPSQRTVNPDIEIRTSDVLDIDPALEADLDSLFLDEGEMRPGYLFHRAQDPRVGGEYVMAYLDDRPIASTGWFVVDGIARFRRVETIQSAWGRGAATAMLTYVQNHPVVQSQDALVIFCNESGPMRLYEEMGFEKHSFYWEFLNAPWASSNGT